MTVFILATTALVGCGKQDLKSGAVSFTEGKVVYGEDGRDDVGVFPDHRFQIIAQSTAIQIPTKTMTDRGSYFQLDTRTLGSKLNLCSDERFAQQSAAGRCSGFLVGPKTLVTAGHCITSQTDCRNNSWVFGYQTNDPQGKVSEVSSEDVYSCVSIIEQKLEQGRGADFAVIELDRVVKGRAPLSFRLSGKITDREDLVVIGNPSGLPTKITGGGFVRENDAFAYFVGSVDTFQGNSGSAVFNERTGEVEGILVRGETDYVQDYSRGCRRVNVCTDYGCRGEDITRITELASLKGLGVVEEEVPELEEYLHDEATYSGQVIPIRDFDLVTLPLEISKSSPVEQISLRIKLSHSYVGDLAIGLRHPNGEVIVLRNRKGARSKGLDQTFQTTELSKFTGKSAQGVWELLIKDFAHQDQGQLELAHLSIN